MAKAKTAYVCDVCGYDTPKWVGKCPSCGSWNTMKEFTVAPSSPSRGAAVVQQAGLHRDTPHPVPLSQIDAAEEPRLDTHDAELNRVLGGGIVPGAVILYVSGEESERQIKLRADRLLPENAAADGMLLLCETRMERIFEEVRAVRPELLIIDSVQTMHTETVESSPGSVTQIRECAAALLKFAKEQGVPVLLIGHITKEGSIAGPKVLEHIVDCVLQFEGDRHYFYRILRSIKNRFGSTAELGIYEMNANGLRPVDNPSELLLTQHDEPLSGVAICAALEGVRPFLIETQALVSTAAYGTPQRSATGFDLRRLNMLLAVLEKRVGFKLGAKDVFLNIAGGLRVTDPAIDLSVIAAVLSSNVDTPIDQDVAMAGECGLSGEIRPVTRIDRRIAEAMKLGFRRFLLPAQNMKSLDAARFSGIELVPVSRVEAALRELFG